MPICKNYASESASRVNHPFLYVDEMQSMPYMCPCNEVCFRAHNAAMGNIYKGKVHCCSVQIRLVVVWLKLMYGFSYVCRSMAFWLFYLTILILQEQSTVHDQLSCKRL